MKTTNLTVKELQERGGDIYQNIEYAKSQRLPYPERISKPYMGNYTSDPKGIRQYADDLEKYENIKVEYDSKRKEIAEFNRSIDLIIRDYISEESGLNDLPVEKRSKIFNKAYDSHHDSGYYSVYQELCELVDLFY